MHKFYVKEKKIKQTAMTVRLHIYHASMNYFHIFFFAVIIISYNNVFTNLKRVHIHDIAYSEINQNFASRFIKYETIRFL